MKTCSIDTCETKVEARGLCCKHYKQYLTQCDRPLKPLCIPLGRANAELFWERVNLTADDARCWHWAAGRDADGYGNVWFDGKTEKSHRVAFYLGYGYWPTRNVLHSCDVPTCCNPNHLRDGSQRENMNDKVAHNRQAKGNMIRCAKLTAETVLKARSIYAGGGHTYADLATMFDVTDSTIHAAVTGKSWSHITI